MTTLLVKQAKQEVQIQYNLARDKEYGVHYANFKIHPKSYLKLDEVRNGINGLVNRFHISLTDK